MFYEQFINIYVIVMTVLGLVISMSRYIMRPHRAWGYIIVYLLGNLMSNYYWGTYVILMNDYPGVSSFMAYLGWSISCIPLILLCLEFRSTQEKKYFNPLCLIPIPLNIAQFMLYLPFGGVLNNVWQGVTCTTIICLGLNSILYFRKYRKNGADRPYVAFTMVLFVILEYTMWTSSCFDWPSSWANPYIYASVVCFALAVVFPWAIDKQLRQMSTYSAEEPDTLQKSSMKILKPLYAVLTLVCCFGGYLFAAWIKSVLDAGGNGEGASSYSIIVAVLFAISLVVVFLSIAIVLVIAFGQKAAESEGLREAKNVAEKSNAAKSDFLASMSHEIRTPINAVLGMNEMILRESLKARDLLPKEREAIRAVFADICNYSGNIESAGNNLLAIINDILDFSKIEAGHLELAEGNYKLSSVLNDVSNMVSFKAMDKGLDFQVDVDETIPDGLYGDEVRVRQIITNLLNNAVKYTVKGGIRLSLSLRDEGPVEEGSEICLVAAVKDTGIGIREEDLDKLFKKFERVDLERNSTVEGTGLGLAIARSVLERMNGSIEVESVYGEGSVFTAYIPQKVVSVESVGSFKEKFAKSIEETKSCEESFHAPDAHILIVDDTRMNLLVAEGLLKNTRIQMDMVTSGAESVELARSIHYDIILMDQRMPIMDGTEAMHLIRSEENGINKDTPFICLTADAVSGARERYISEGFTDYLTKPIDSKALERMLRKYLPQEKIILNTERIEEPEMPENRTLDADEGQLNEYEVLREADIDPGTGLSYSQNNAELYRTFLTEYLRGSVERISSLESFYRDKDWENYGIQAHALKSTSKTIGALTLSDMAKDLEQAANEGEEEKLLAEHETMMDRYRKVTEAIREYIPQEENETDITGADQMDPDDEILEFLPEEE